MANTITLEQLRTDSRNRADMLNSQFISDSELNVYINKSYSELYDILVSKFEDYYTVSTILTIANLAQTVALPTDFYKGVGVDAALDETQQNWYPLPKFSFINRDIKNQGFYALWNPQTCLCYRYIKNNLMIVPQSIAPNLYRLWYVPVYTPLDDDADTVDGINGWEDYIVIDAAIKMLTKEESSTTALEKAKADMLNRIEAMAQNRDPGAPEVITNVRQYDYGYGDFFYPR